MSIKSRLKMIKKHFPVVKVIFDATYANAYVYIYRGKKFITLRLPLYNDQITLKDCEVNLEKLNNNFNMVYSLYNTYDVVDKEFWEALKFKDNYTKLFRLKDYTKE